MNNDIWPYDLLAPIYEVDMARNMSFDDLSTYLQMIGPGPGQMVEVGAGTGRLTVGFLEAGWEVIAVEKSKPMLARLQSVANDWLGSSLHCVRTDVLDMPIPKIRRWDAVVLPYSVICYITDTERLDAWLKKIRGAMKPGGTLILDAFIPRQAVAAMGEFQLDYNRKLSDGLLERHKKITPLNDGVNQIDRRYIITKASGQKVIETRSFIRPFEPKELRELVAQSGFHCQMESHDYGESTAETEARFYTLKATVD